MAFSAIPYALTRFQFHKGTIRTHVIAQVLAKKIAFQFHKGTIRTILSPGIISQMGKFQFHKGTIRTTGG